MLPLAAAGVLVVGRRDDVAASQASASEIGHASELTGVLWRSMSGIAAVLTILLAWSWIRPQAGRKERHERPEALRPSFDDATDDV
jgi:hypothetical protein